MLAILASFRLAAATRRDMLFEIAALRQQLEIMRRSGVKPRFRRSDRRFWIGLVRNWPNWRHGVVILKPETIIRWHGDGYRRFWRFRSAGKPGRPRIPRRHIAFIKQISRENPAWGEDRIALEMKLKLGIEQPRARDLRFGLHPPGLVGFFCVLRVGDHRVANTNFGACERDEKSDFEMGAAADP